MGSPPQDDCSHGVYPVRSQVDYLLIGARWKLSNECSPGVLTDRGLDLLFYLYAVFSVFPFLVLMVQWPHSDSIPHSVVKRCYGYDTLGVAPRDNSSVPGSSLTKKNLFSSIGQRFFFVFPLWIYFDSDRGFSLFSHFRSILILI